jgi:hypothetical protein
MGSSRLSLDKLPSLEGYTPQCVQMKTDKKTFATSYIYLDCCLRPVSFIEIDSKIKDIYEKAEKLIDLSNQIILGLDTPQDTLFDAIMALMSQDFPGDQKYEYTEKSSSNRMGRKVNRLRGMPVLFTSRVIDDTRAPRFSEKNRRFSPDYQLSSLCPEYLSSG